MTIQVILFDVGGVLVQLTGVPMMLEWLGGRHTLEELWSIWLHSPSVRAFETGQIDAPTFAQRLVGELDAQVEPQRCLSNRSPAGPPVCTRACSKCWSPAFRRAYTRALLSNSNVASLAPGTR